MPMRRKRRVISSASRSGAGVRSEAWAVMRVEGAAARVCVPAIEITATKARLIRIGEKTLVREGVEGLFTACSFKCGAREKCAVGIRRGHP